MAKDDKPQQAFDAQKPAAGPGTSDAIAELRAEMRQLLEQERDSFRERLKEEREIHGAQMDAMRADRDEALHRLRTLKPADVGTTTLLVENPTPAARRAARPLPTEGILEMELTHGSFVGEVEGAHYAHESPAQPGALLRFDMAKKAHAKTAQMLRDSGCAERA